MTPFKRLTQAFLTVKYYIEGFRKFKYPLHTTLHSIDSLWVHRFAQKFIDSEEDRRQFKSSVKYVMMVNASDTGHLRIYPVFTNASYTGNVLELQFYSDIIPLLRASTTRRPLSHVLPMFIASLMHILPPLLQSLKPGYIYVAHVYRPLNKWYFRLFIHLLGVRQIHFTDSTSSFLYAR